MLAIQNTVRSHAVRGTARGAPLKNMRFMISYFKNSKVLRRTFIWTRDRALQPGFSLLWLPFFTIGLVIFVPFGRLTTLCRRALMVKPRILWSAYALSDTGYLLKCD